MPWLPNGEFDMSTTVNVDAVEALIAEVKAHNADARNPRIEAITLKGGTRIEFCDV